MDVRMYVVEFPDQVVPRVLPVSVMRAYLLSVTSPALMYGSWRRLARSFRPKPVQGLKQADAPTLMFGDTAGDRCFYSGGRSDLNETSASRRLCVQWKEGKRLGRLWSDLKQMYPVQVTENATAALVQSVPVLEWLAERVLNKKETGQLLKEQSPVV